MNILCGTDFSPNATDAVKVAAALSRRFNDSLTLVHATFPPVDQGISPEVWLPVEAVLREQLEKLAIELRNQGTVVRSQIEMGTPTDVLRRKTKPGSTRLVVVASIGRVALARVLLGSTADRLAESLPVPTLVVRKAQPFLEWIEGSRPLRVVTAVDFSESSDAALGLARELAAVGNCELRAVYVAGGEDDEDPAPGTPGNRVQSELKEKVSAQLDPHPFTLSVVPAGQTPSEGLIDLARKSQADLIITGAHQHRGLGRLWRQSTSRALLADAPVNVAVVPARAQNLARTRIPPLSRVLVTTDLSPLGNRAIPAACALLPLGGTLRILHFVPPIERAFSLLGGRAVRPVLSPGEHRELMRHARRQLGSLFPAEAVRRRITPEVIVEAEADVAGAILNHARQFGAHVICLASHGRGAALSALFGSVAQQVIGGSDRPVHVVRIRAA